LDTDEINFESYKVKINVSIDYKWLSPKRQFWKEI
jgi:hypothetical protein